ncbi:MAG: HAMP domain-containing protein [Phycisphaerae bacterium]|nr:HAMP domain-containing protein [Phycisphaerae bacterium]
MRSLFLKIFFWFWLANVLGAGAMMLAMWVGFGGGPPGFHPGMHNALTMWGRGAVAVLDHDGPDALRAYLDGAAAPPFHSMSLFDDRGTELTTGTASDQERELAMRVIRDGAPVAPDPGSFPLAAVRVHGSDGRSYAVIEQRPPGPFGRPGVAVWFLVMRLLAVVLPGGVICYGLSRYLTAPLRRLRTAAQRLAHGDLKVRAGPKVLKRRDEIGQLGRDFDFMAERVESLMSAQRRLLRDMSHELRSPLARLNIALGLVGESSDPETAAAIDRIEREAGRLEELIAGLLTLSRLEGGGVGIADGTVDLDELLQGIAADAGFEANGRGGRVCLRIADACAVPGSPELLRSAVENVVRNAVHYTAAATDVEVSLRQEARNGASEAVISVRDHGAGVPEAMLGEIFRPFYRVADARDRETGGTGLGLAIADRAVRMHGGAISATNAPEGGLVVEIRLPVTNHFPLPSGGSPSLSDAAPAIYPPAAPHGR